MNEHPSDFVHLLSDVEVWKRPDRNYFTFVILSILLGFFGVDHIYLRSFPTAIAKTVINLCTLGLWYMWDLLQIFSDSERIRREGLNSPFDWVKGIGRGVFTNPGDAYASQKDYVLYTILTFFGCLGADKFYIGEYGQGILKLISCFNIFLFLFGWAWVAWDMFHAVFTMRTVMSDGISSPLPYSFLFSPINAKELFEVRSVKDAPKLSFIEWLKSFIPSFSLPSLSFLPGMGIFSELFELLKPLFVIGKSGVKLVTQMKQDGEQILGGAASSLQAAMDPGRLATLAAQSVQGAQTAAAAAAVPLPAGGMLPQMPLPAGGMLPQMPLPAGGMLPQMPQMLPQMPQMLPQMPQMPQMLPQVGGARSEESGSGLGPVLAGSLAALLLAGGAKGFYDFIRKQV